MVLISRTALEYRQRDEHLRACEVRPHEALGGAGELVYALEALGVGLDDVARVLRLSGLVTARSLPGSIDDACTRYRIGVVRLEQRRWSAGAQLGAYGGCIFLAWTT